MQFVPEYPVCNGIDSLSNKIFLFPITWFHKVVILIVIISLSPFPIYKEKWASPDSVTSLSTATTCLRILTRFPFDEWHALCTWHRIAPSLKMTNPCPFSTSVFNVLIWIFATTTKICIGACFAHAHAQSCTTTPMLSYSSRPRTCNCSRTIFVSLVYILLYLGLKGSPKG